MTRKEFNDLSKRYLDGQATLEEERLLQQWMEGQRPEPEPEWGEYEAKLIRKRMWKNVLAGIPRAGRVKRLWAIVPGMAAAACLLAGLWWYHGEKEGAKGQADTVASVTHQGIEVANTTSSEQPIKLSDGTLVRLKPGSRLRYEKSFNGQRREVFLQGEAFFQVKRNPLKPFVVHAGELVTEVLGTSFLIRQRPGSNTTEVAVASGKVSVYTQNTGGDRQRNGVILTPNQQVSYDAATRNIITGIVPQPVPIASAKAAPVSLNFQVASLQTVLDALTQVYGIEFVVANPKLKDCSITADLSGLSMFTQLELVCKSIDAAYEKRGTVVFIEGDGC
ncbi:FecR family protein [Dyadobacter sp. SG02]|uniref:FecR family protein n=1 Tax=Dyadobacter sp. SG02 TaxID=1855291 RepID=UPI0008B9A4EA|nr:FecR family protein [Dyadobacter sp. SG02]SEI54122.1 FecR family protein [Dyadobacter sp. SG02]